MGKQITLRGLDPPLDQNLRAEARRRGLSLNQMALQLLRQAVGLDRPPTEPVADAPLFTDLDHLAGTWSVEEAEAFDRALGASRQVDAELWR